MRRSRFALIVFLCISTVAFAFAHCEIPCGIYGDSLRFAMIREHVETIEKSMREIKSIGGERKPDYHQLVRWINNKEYHAELLQDIISQYFLHQRIHPVTEGEPGRENYLIKIELMHRILVSAMKCKQGTDPADARRILDHLDLFEKMYWEEHGHQH
jgi:nickel superoxide dismutase